ncbi:TolC family protein [Chitinophaga sp. Cy-1792]|uniref:TolC family protein n=1 Tax=Chitinophaga sp. Cy-1792 TaxID=2608339 RepID=UPI00142088D5|nr:TolC family protein [Chitinophaga sp. Cy-1792]NIG56402.1 TolC family protein [Chitinophaga sp. Cy-1792]
MKRTLFLLGCLCLSRFAGAQVRFNSLEEIWRYADKNNIQLLTAAGNQSMASDNVKQAYGALLPTVTATGGFTDNVKIQSTLIPANLFNSAAPPGTFTQVAFGTKYIYNGAIAAQLNILNTQDWFHIKAARLNEELAAQNMAKTKADLYTQLANAYYSYLLLREAAHLSQENLRTTSAIYELSDNKYKDGQISEVTLNTAKINREKAVKNQDIALQQQAVQLNNLKLMLNIKDSLALATVLSATELQAAGKNVFEEDPAIRIAYTQLQLSKNTLRNSRAALTPVLSAFYQYSTQIAANQFVKFENSSNTPAQYWGLRLSVPVFSGNTKRYEIAKNKTDYSNKQLLYDNARLQSQISDENLLISYHSAQQAFLRARDILDLYRKNDEHATLQLQEGIISLDDRLKVFADLITNQNDYLQSMSDYFIQEYNMQVRQTKFQ